MCLTAGSALRDPDRRENETPPQISGLQNVDPSAAETPTLMHCGGLRAPVPKDPSVNIPKAIVSPCTLPSETGIPPLPASWPSWQL